jgi:hypothetical protein
LDYREIQTPGNSKRGALCNTSVGYERTAKDGKRNKASKILFFGCSLLRYLPAANVL